jgi:hypothetical protein
MEKQLLNPAFIPAILIFIILGIALATLKILKRYHGLKKRRTPFTSNFLRSPGQSLIEKLDAINDDLAAYMAMLFVAPILFYALYISNLYFQKRPFSLSTGFFYLLGGALFIGYLIFKMVRLLNHRRSIRLGYEGEVATGQELNQMMLQGYHVYHDFVADSFNIDHIIVGPTGVFAVETKARAKPTSNNRKEDAHVTYNGHCLHFPRWKETKPLEQAKNQAKWLSRWLSSATGEPTAVRPVLALPGWFVTRTSSEGILVINPRQFGQIARPLKGSLLDDRRIKSIVHQIDQRCRNIESKAVEGLGGRN